MNSGLPSIAKRANHLGLLGQILIFAVLDITTIDKRLKIRPIFDSVRRVDVDHLDLPRHSLLFQQRVHYKQAVARDQPVRPVMRMFIELNRLPNWRILFRSGEERHLRAVSVAPTNNLDDSPRIDSFVNV
jgi:hypothetical protein